MKTVQFFSNMPGTIVRIPTPGGRNATYTFSGGYATLEGSRTQGVLAEHVETMRSLSQRVEGMFEIPAEAPTEESVEKPKPSAKAGEIRIMMDDGTYRYLTDDQLREMLKISDLANSDVDQDEPTVPGGAELKARRKERGLSLRQASEQFNVSVATISRWEKLGELYGKNLAMYEGLKEVTA